MEPSGSIFLRSSFTLLIRFVTFIQMNNKPFEGKDHGTDRMDFRHIGPAIEMMPVEIHVKQDGDLEGNPSFAIVLRGEPKISVIGQISLRMLNDGLSDIGYKISKV